MFTLTSRPPEAHHNRASKLLLVMALSVAVAACTDVQKSVGPSMPTSSARLENVELSSHAVSPQATDPAINVALDQHLVFLPTRGARNGRLFLFLASSRVPPAVSQIFEREAAMVGYHVIALSYPNTPGLASFCPAASNPNACYDQVRRQIITGSPQTAFVSVNAANSVDNRLEKALAYLDAQYPEEGWSQFLDDEGGIKWKKIAVGGHSQGAGHAAMIAKLRFVDRVVLLSGVTDGVSNTGASWVTPGETPADRIYALSHLRDAQFSPYYLANWQSLGLFDFGSAVAPEASFPPFDGVHTFVTDLLPATGNYTAPAPHASTGVDFAVRLDGQGNPVLRPVWRYMLGYCPTPNEISLTPSCG